jgi:hypothetical protein
VSALRPGDLLGLPLPDTVLHVAAFRYAMVGLVVVWALLAARARPWLSFLGGVLFAVTGVGFWTLALARPYGLLTDAAISGRVAECAVGAASGGWEGVRSGLAASGIGAWLGRAGVGAETLALAPTLLAPFVIPLLAVLVAVLWSRRDLAWLAGLLWLAFATGDLDGLTPAGLVPGLWAHPFGALGLVATALLVLAGARIWKGGAAAPVLALGVVAGWVAAAIFWGRLGEAVTPLRGLERLLLVTLQQGLWLPLGAYGLWRHGDAAARALAAAGAVLLLVPWPDSVALEPWGPHALYRLGLVLAAAAPVGQVCGDCGAWLRPHLPALARRDDRAVGAGLLLLALAPGAFLVWWHPVQLDPVFASGLDPVPPAVVEIAAAVRAHAGPQAVVVAAPGYAAPLMTLAGRRVLRAPLLARSDDEDLRWRAEEKVLAGRTGDRLVQRYGVSHVLVGPGDFIDRGLERPEDLESRGPFTLVYDHGAGIRLYAIR